MKRAIALACALGLAFTFAGMTARLIVWPPTSGASQADAVVVFGARSHAERLAEGLRLANEGVAPVLVLLAPPEGDVTCRSELPYEVICIWPEPFSTRGEARATGELAAERGWDTLLLVTSAYHLTRAGILLSRCFDGSVHALAVESADGLERSLERIAHEWAGLIAAYTIARDC